MAPTLQELTSPGALSLVISKICCILSGLEAQLLPGISQAKIHRNAFLIFLPILPPLVSTTIFHSFRKGIRGFLLPAREEVTLDVLGGGDTGMTQPPARGQEALAFLETFRNST